MSLWGEEEVLRNDRRLMGEGFFGVLEDRGTEACPWSQWWMLWPSCVGLSDPVSNGDEGSGAEV